MGLGWTVGEAEDGAVSGVADISSLEASPGRENCSGLKVAVMFSDTGDSEGGNGLGDDSGLEWSSELDGRSGLGSPVTVEDIL